MVHNHLTQGHPSPCRGQGQLGISLPDTSFPRLISSISWLQTTQKEAKYSRLAGERFNKQGNFQERLVWGAGEMSCSPHLPARLLSVYIEALKSFSHIYHPAGLNTLLFLCVLENGSGCGNCEQKYLPRKGKGVRCLLFAASIQLAGQLAVIFSG